MGEVARLWSQGVIGLGGAGGGVRDCVMDGGSGGAWWGAQLEGVHACRGDERL